MLTEAQEQSYRNKIPCLQEGYWEFSGSDCYQDILAYHYLDLEPLDKIIISLEDSRYASLRIDWVLLVIKLPTAIQYQLRAGSRYSHFKPQIAVLGRDERTDNRTTFSELKARVIPAATKLIRQYGAGWLEDQARHLSKLEGIRKSGY